MQRPEQGGHAVESTANAKNSKGYHKINNTPHFSTYNYEYLSTLYKFPGDFSDVDVPGVAE